MRAIAPHWSYVNEDGMPPIDSIMAMQDYWSGLLHLRGEKGDAGAAFRSLGSPRRRKRRLDREKPFGN